MESIENINNNPEENNIEVLQNKADRLRNNLPDSQTNTRSQATQDLLDFAAELYDVPKYSETIESGKYVSWLQDLGMDGYNASMKLNSPRQALDELLKRLSSMK